LDRLEDRAVDVDHQAGHLHRFQALVFFGGEFHPRFQDLVEVPGELLQLALCVGPHPGIGGRLLGLNQDLHLRSLPQ
jgi:hypothetical protein